MLDEKFWIRLWTMCIIAVATMVGGCQVSEYAKDKMVSEAISKGVDPIKATCAIKGTGTDTKALICAEAAKK